MPIDTVKKVLGLVASAFPALAAEGLSAVVELEQTIEQVEGAICGALAEVAKGQEGLAAVTQQRDEARARGYDEGLEEAARHVEAHVGALWAVSREPKTTPYSQRLVTAGELAAELRGKKVAP